MYTCIGHCPSILGGPRGRWLGDSCEPTLIQVVLCTTICCHLDRPTSFHTLLRCDIVVIAVLRIVLRSVYRPLMQYVISSVRSTRTELNWTDLQQVDPVTQLTGCSETRTDSAQSLRALWALSLESVCLVSQFANSTSVQFSPCAVNKPQRFPWGMEYSQSYFRACVKFVVFHYICRALSNWVNMVATQQCCQLVTFRSKDSTIDACHNVYTAYRPNTSLYQIGSYSLICWRHSFCILC